MPALGNDTYDPTVEISRLYLAAQRSFVELARTLSPDQWATPVPCTPGWCVRDVLSHVAGVTDDVAVLAEWFVFGPSTVDIVE